MCDRVRRIPLDFTAVSRESWLQSLFSRSSVGVMTSTGERLCLISGGDA